MSIKDTVKEKLTSILPSRFNTKQSYNSTSNITGSSKNGKYDYNSLFNRDISISYSTARKLLKDPQVKVGWAILKYFLVSKNYNLTSNSDNPEDLEITEFVQDCFDNMNIPFNKVLNNIITAIPYGFSVQEIVYTVNNEGKIVIDALYPVHIKTLQNEPFVRDKKGELTHIHQETTLGSVNIPREKVFLYSYDNEFDEIRGRSILAPMRPIVEDKENIKDWLYTFLNRIGSPIMYGKTDNKVARDALLDAFDDVANGTTGLTVGRDDELGVIETSNKGEAYFNALQYNDLQILRLFFLGDQLLGDGNTSGAYAKSNTQKDMLLYIMNGILSDIGMGFQTLVNTIVSYNFGVDAKSPSFKFESFIDKDLIGLLSALQPYIGNGSLDSDNPAFKELLSKLFMNEADIKMDTSNNTESTDDTVDYGYQEDLEDTPTAEDIVNTVLGDII